MSEQLEILRRIAERGRNHALIGVEADWGLGSFNSHSAQLDMWQNLLYELERDKAIAEDLS